MIRFGLVTDMHFGPEVRFKGQLRKMSHRAAELAADVAASMRDMGVDFLVNLGDSIEDETPTLDRQRYQQSVDVLARCGRRVIHVAGNHDTANLTAAELNSCWSQPSNAPLYRSFEQGDVLFLVLHSVERKDRDVRIDDEQLRWLGQQLAAGDTPVVVLMHHSAAEQDLRENRWFAGAPHICLIKERRSLRRILEQSGRVVAVFNGHLHWNHLDVIGNIPYITLQSLIENVDDDAPGRAAAAHAVVRLSQRQLLVEVAGLQPARYQFQLR
jgi:3',5'-cyclic-AMP phosphodiesterase